MIKRVLLFVGLFMFLMPVGNAFAAEWDYKNGLLDNAELIEENKFPKEIYDNDLNTSNNGHFGFNNSYVKFKKPINIKGYYVNTSSENLHLYYIYLNDNGSRSEQHSFVRTRDGYFNIDLKNVIEIRLQTQNRYLKVYEIDFFESSLIKMNDVENIAHASNHENINLTYDLPDEFDHIEINVDGKTYETTKDNFILENLEPDTSYDITFYTILDGIRSEGVTYTAKTDKEPEPEPPEEKEVTNVKAKTKHNRVDLSWDLPESDEFEHVTIYRKMLENNTSSIFNLIVPKTYASDPYDPIFETNGTYFNDLTVEAATGYEYRLTSTHDGKETPGVTVQATTEPPIVEGGGIEKDENGDYVYKWNEPTTGQVKIYVDGKEYKTVDASDGKITIPADDMKYNAFGDPLVTSQAIAPNGTPGNIGGVGGGTIGGIVLPFEVNDLVKSGNGLLYLVGGFVLLSLAFMFIPRLIKLIRDSFNSYKNKNNRQDRRVRG